MNLPAALKKEFRDEVIIETWASQNAYGEPTYSTCTHYPARVEVRSRLIAGLGGTELSARGRVLLATADIPSTKDRMTLPAWAAPTQPPILDVQAHLNDGMDHVIVYFG